MTPGGDQAATDPEEPKVLRGVDFLYVNLTRGPDGIVASAVVRDRSTGRLIEVPGGPVTVTRGRQHDKDEVIRAFLTARYDEDQWWAREASRTSHGGSTPSGEHWRWEDADDDQPLTPDPVTEAYIGEGAHTYRVGLRSVEEYQTQSVGMLSHVMFSAEEVETAVGGHIVRHDPARVLREVEAKRRRLARHSPHVVAVSSEPDGGTEHRLACRHCTASGATLVDADEFVAWPCPDLIDDAQSWADHPNFPEELRLP